MTYVWADVLPGQLSDDVAINALGNTVEAHDVSIPALEGPLFCELQSTNVTANFQALAINTFIKILMITAVEDNATMADLANSEIVCKKAGLYDLFGQIPFQSVATGTRGAFLRHTAAVGGAITYKAGDVRQAANGDATRMRVSRPGVRLALNDRIGLYAYVTSAVTLEGTTYGGALLSAKYVGK